MGEKVTLKNCVIFGGNISELDRDIIKHISDKTYIICADKGYEAAKKLNLTPDLIVGDFDSTEKPITNTKIIELPIKKDDTDLHYAAKEAVNKGFTNFILSCVTGGRLDQTIATFFTANYLINMGCQVQIFDYNSKIFFTNSTLKINKPNYNCYLSVFPLENRAEGVCVMGTEYEMLNGKLESDFPIGVSNSFLLNEVSVSVVKGKLAVMLIRK